MKFSPNNFSETWKKINNTKVTKKIDSLMDLSN